jgi:hypothetical protein
MSLDYIDPSTTTPPPDWAGAIFPEPMLYRLAPLWVFLLVLAVLGMLFYRQRLLDARSDGRRAPAIIFRAVRGAIDRALLATGPATIPAGQKVIETVRLYLGPILAFSGEFGAPFHKLEKAVAGKAEQGEKHDHHTHGSSEPRHGTLVVTTAGHEGQVVADKVIQVVSPGQVIAVTDAPPSHDHGKQHGHHEGMSTHEQTAAVRYALERLHEFWTADTVEPRLKAIRDALSIRKPKGGGLSREPYRRPPVEQRRRPARPAERKTGL